MSDNETIKEKKPLTKTEKILNIVGIVLICIMGPILVLDAIMLIQSAVNKDDVPSIFGVKPLVIMSESMELNDGNVESIESYAREELKDPSFVWLNKDPINMHDLAFFSESDIESYLKTKSASDIDEVNKQLVGKTIAFKSPSSTGEGWAVVVHRIAKVERATVYSTDCGWILRTYGIHNNVVDSPSIDPGLVIGEYTGTRIGGVGAFVDFLQHWYGIVIFAGVPIAAVICYDLVVAKRNAQLQADSKTAELEAELQKLKAEKAAREAAEKEKEE